MEKGKVYKLGMEGGPVTVKLHDIQTYGATGMPSDYIFEYQEGSPKLLVHPEGEKLFGSADRFPIPEGLIPLIEKEYGIEEVT